MYTVKEGNKDKVMYLLDEGTDVNSKDEVRLVSWSV
jgi:hypothetical protein